MLLRSKYFYITDIALLGTFNELPLMANLAVSRERREKINFLGFPRKSNVQFLCTLQADPPVT